MDKYMLLIRHCSSQGPAPESPLTEAGNKEAVLLSDALARHEIGRIVSSPYRRAYQTIEPFALRSGITIETDARLREFDLGDYGAIEWFDAWRACLGDLDFKYPRGESGRLATQRILEVVNEIWPSIESSAVIVTHGRTDGYLVSCSSISTAVLTSMAGGD
jgi:2,3-bisphosphoglycerate-dependent phosphoglycerate mutase